MLTKHYRNISNYFSIVEDLGRALDWIMDSDSEAVFGAEAEVEGEHMSLSLISPPYIRLGDESTVDRLVDREEGLTCYEGYLVEPFFLPLYGALNGLLVDDLESFMLEEGDAVSIQWLLKRRTDDWKHRAVEMYSSFLEGNDYPFHSKLGRKVQDKVLYMLNKVSSFNMTKTYINEVEKKLMQEGFQFQLRVLVKSLQPDNIRDRLEELMKKYDAHNALRLIKVKPKRFLPLYRDAVLTYDTHTQILSRTEVASLFGGKAPVVEAIPVVVERAPSQPVAETTAIVKKIDTSGLLSLLPYYPREDILVDESIVADIAEAMKRVGLINSARLYNHVVTAGVRLTVVQCDIPNGKTLTQLSSKVIDIQAELGVQSLSVEQGTEAGTVKFSIPNEEPAVISLRELMELESFQEFAKENPLAFVVGVDEVNTPIYLSLTKLVHLLVAGSTGSGKSVFVNTLIVSLLAMNTPDELRMYMIDPKQVEMQHFDGFPHVEEVITDMDDANDTLKSIVEEMERRYSIFKDSGVKNISIYNQKMPEKMPYIVCVIDEYADLKDTHPEVEDHIARLGQKARAAGIHMVIATQRPEAKIISGRVKAVIPSAISFFLKSNTDYRTVFGRGIGFTLLGRGDGVMKIEGYPKEYQRFQSAIISPDEGMEEGIYNQMRDYLSSVPAIPLALEEPLMEIIEGEVEIADDEDLLEKLKKIISETGETKTEELRKALGVKNTTVIELMSKLVDEGFLIKHKSKAKGYEIASEENLEKIEQ